MTNALLVIDNPDSPIPPDDILIEVANGVYGLGNRFAIDWEQFYDTLEIYGYDMQHLGGPVDNRIRRIVREAVKNGEVS